ncbi:MAG: DUF192 domain-containing protein [Microgenomates group bacterium]
MKKIYLLVFALIFLFFVFQNNFFSQKFYQIKINGKTYYLLTAKNSQEWERGLMFYKSKKELNGADGMIFIFPNKDYRSFWNMNTYLDLDIYWLDDDKIVGQDFLPSINKTKELYTITSKEKVNRVVEIVR